VPGENSQLLTIEELSRKSRLSIATIHRLRRAGKIPFFQPAGKGGVLRFPADAIEQAGCSTAVPPPPATVSEIVSQRLSGPAPGRMAKQAKPN
jgi:hypothetical protein